MTVPASIAAHSIHTASDREAVAAQAFVARTIEQFSGKDCTTVVTIPAPLSSLEAVLDRDNGELGLLWSPADGEKFVGLGATHRIELEGVDRFEQLREEVAAIHQRIEVVPYPGTTPPTPRFFGGLAFAAGLSSEPPWTDFGDGSFTLPRWTYCQQSDRASLSLAFRGEEVGTPAVRDTMLGQLTHLYSTAASPEQEQTITMPRQLTSQQMSLQEWRVLVDAIRRTITTGQFDKIVVARRTVVELNAALRDVDVLRRFPSTKPIIRFAFRRGGRTFLGATPERLITKQGMQVGSDALAGSADTGREGALLASRKDREEQSIVVRDIVAALQPRCGRLSYPVAPVISILSHVAHLHTPIEGELDQPAHVLDLVEDLHPTSAVGGAPSADAVAWIARHEKDRRGWYAGPVGWFDVHGDGEFAVALRSGVLDGSRAYLYAGAGIVRGSDPDKEYAETTFKQRSFLQGLGVAP